MVVLPVIPDPPVIFSAPVVVLVLDMPELLKILPYACIFPPIIVLAEIYAAPFTCNFARLLSVAVPINTLPNNSASLISPSSSTSMLGTPEISFTANIVPVWLSVIENNCPLFPDTVIVSESSMLTVIVLASFGDIKSMFCVCRPFLTANFLVLAIGSLSPNRQN